MNKTIQTLFAQAMNEQLPKGTALEPLHTELAVEKALAQTVGLTSISRKQLRALVSLLEIRFHMLMSQLAISAVGPDSSQIQGRVREVSGLMAFFRHLLSAKEEIPNG